MIQWDDIHYFFPFEFDSPDEKESGWKMNIDFIHGLDSARQISGIPYIINSGYRTEAHNKEVGGTKDSSHLKGLAVDIKYETAEEFVLIMKGLLFVGFTRFGLGETFIHVDDDKSKPTARWFYPFRKGITINSVQYWDR